MTENDAYFELRKNVNKEENSRRIKKTTKKAMWEKTGSKAQKLKS